MYVNAYYNKSEWDQLLMINGTIRISSVWCNYMWEEREKADSARMA